MNYSADNPIPFAFPSFGEEEHRRVRAVIESGWVSQGPVVAEFERRLGEYLGVRDVVAANSCTSALLLALKVHDIGPGDEVICPVTTCIATVNPVLLLGADCVLADVDERTLNLDSEEIEKHITPRTRAILGVDQVGLPADWDALAAAAKKHDLIVIEDAACALGAQYRSRRVGGLGWTTTFSFHPRKIIATGEGGVVAFADPALADRARRLRSHGAAVSDMVRHRGGGTIRTTYPEAGMNVRMTDMQGALGVEQLRRIDDFLEQRTRIAERYNRGLADLPDFEPPFIPVWAKPSYQSYLLRIRNGREAVRNELMAYLVERGVSCRHGIPPLHWEECFADVKGSFPAAETVARDSLFLPIYPGLSAQAQDYILETLHAFAADHFPTRTSS
jgi:perosamine synthetase